MDIGLLGAGCDANTRELGRGVGVCKVKALGRRETVRCDDGESNTHERVER